MSLTDHLLAALSLYGLPVLFGVIAIAAAGVPMPVTLMLVAAGSFVELGQMTFWQVILVSSTAAILGDQIGYAIGRWGGHRVADRLRRRKNGEARLVKAHAFAERWGGAGVFFSRWLVTPLGPWLNLTSGMTGYSWARFFLWDILGETLWVVIYVSLGIFFSDRVQALLDILGNLAWVLVGLMGALILGWQLLRSLRPVEASANRKAISKTAA